MALTNLTKIRREWLNRADGLVLVRFNVNNVPPSGGYIPAGSMGLSDIFDVLQAEPKQVGTVTAGINAAADVVFVDDAVADTTVTIGDITYTFDTTLDDVPYEVLSGADATASATNLVYAINASGGTEGVEWGTGTVAHPEVTAELTDTATVTVTARYPGVYGNTIGLATAGDADVTVEAAVLEDGADQTIVASNYATNEVVFADDPVDTSTVTVNGVVYTFETGAQDAAYKVLSATDAATSATNFAHAINGTATPGTEYGVGTLPHPFVVAQADAGTVTLTARVSGSWSNALTLSTSGDADITVTAATFSGGADGGMPIIAHYENSQTESVAGSNAGDLFLRHSFNGYLNINVSLIGTATNY